MQTVPRPSVVRKRTNAPNIPKPSRRLPPVRQRVERSLDPYRNSPRGARPLTTVPLWIAGGG